MTLDTEGSMIELRSLGKQFGSRVAVEALDLSLERGEILGLLGHNGAGKSTTIGMILGQVWPTSGAALQAWRVRHGWAR